MQVIFRVLAQALTIYSLLIVARIILTWFSLGNHGSGIVQLLSRITDPYLNWWRKRFSLRAGFMDFTPLVAMAALQVLQIIFNNIAIRGAITLGAILAILVSAAWSVVSFLLWFCIIVLGIRLIGFLLNKGMYGTLWRIVDSLAQPILYRITRIFFRNRIVNFAAGIAVSIAAILAVWLVGGFLVGIISASLFNLPV